MDVVPGRGDQVGDEDHGLTHFYMAHEKYVDVKVFNLLGLSSPIFSTDEFVDGLDFAGLEFLLH